MLRAQQHSPVAIDTNENRAVPHEGGDQMNRNGEAGGGMNHDQGGGMGGGIMMARMQQMDDQLRDTAPGSGQSAFDLIKQVVNQLEADPKTNWEQINIAALGQHLTDMNQVMLYADIEMLPVAGGARYIVTGDDRTAEAIQRMVPTHAIEVQREIGWNTETETRQGGVDLTVRSDDVAQMAKIRGLGFLGFMVQGEHHEDHHLMMVGGKTEAHDGMNHEAGHAMNHGDQTGGHN